MISITQIENLRAPYYRAFTKAWNKELYSHIAPYIEALKDPNFINYIGTIEIENKNVRELFLKSWILPGRVFAIKTQNDYKKITSLPIRVKGNEQEYFDRFMYEYVNNEAGNRITSITETNKDAILRTIKKGLIEGEEKGMGADEMARYIQEKLRNDMQIISRYSAERIARTEIVGASNRGQLFGAQSLGYNMQKTWIPFFDSRTRTFEKGSFNHAITETVGLYDKYQGTGQIGGIDHPGDPKGEAGNVINCRCSQGFTVL